jgi:uncharacterized protein YcaQ
VLPILHGDRLIGRLDPEMDRKRKVLRIHNIYAEADAPPDPETGAAVAAAIADLAEFLGATRVEYTDRVPEGWAAALR